ncbi:SLC12A1 [Cordylochernes scorpioides]|uniref:SLC12A1 n=1 Tax=Cordylochernes scorpioides TaxID=51811 RepID=A0ABY6KUL2_9ARAC|nr:SLC12A1 [Cordylochernes scorpioides]
MLFLRLPWVVGQAGLGYSFLIITMASIITIITSMSMAAICTNGEVRGGGTYYMISRSLGPEFGGAIGLVFSVANAVGAALYTVGYAETITALIKYEANYYMLDGAAGDIRIHATIAVSLLVLIGLVGADWEAKAQMVLMAILTVAWANFFIGTFLRPSAVQVSQGFLGWSTSLLSENFFPDFREGHNFFTIFAIYFPSATGILAGANISGDLADPQTAIPKGTFLSILTTTIIYALTCLASGSSVLRDANGVVELATNASLRHQISNCTLAPNGVCPYGLQNDRQTMQLLSIYGPIIYAGIFAATLSSALASLVSAPKIFQALAKDRLFPKIHMFAREYGRSKEPWLAYGGAYILSVACIMMGNLDYIAPIISNFFLGTYCLINFATFHASWAESPGFRPSFKYYNLWVSLLGSIFTLIIMFFMSYVTALLTVVIVGLLVYYMYQRKPDVNWGSSNQAKTYKDALGKVLELNSVAEHVKNYRPQIMVLTGNPRARPALVDFGSSITKNLSLMVCGHVLKGMHHQRTRVALSRQAYQFLNRRRVKAFYTLVENNSFSRGAYNLTQLSGIGKLRPNMVLMGYKSNWQTCPPEEVEEYFNIIHTTFDLHLSLGILRLQEGFDCSEYLELAAESEFLETNGKAIPRNVSSAQLSQVLKPTASWLTMFAAFTAAGVAGGSSRNSSPPSTPQPERVPLKGGKAVFFAGEKTTLQVPAALMSAAASLQDLSDSPRIPKEVLLSANQFQKKQKRGTVDVWWLYDDGGLTMLIPYLLTTRSQWSKCKLRVFALANKKDELDREQRNMAALLNKFRIDYSDVRVLADVAQPAQESTQRMFDSLTAKWMINTSDPSQLGIRDSEISALKLKTNRQLRLRELLLEHSRDASLIVMTLPMPIKDTCPAPLFMAWLEMLTRDMPPVLLIRGNQTNVLTFYS